MKTLGVSLNDLIENEELLGLLRARLNSGSVKIEELTEILNEAAKHPAPSTPSVTSVEAPAAVAKDSATSKKMEIRVHQTTGIRYVMHNYSTIGILVEGKGLRFVFALKNAGRNITIGQAKAMAQAEPQIDGISWIVPSDEHFRAIQSLGIRAINQVLGKFGGDSISSIPFLSTTSQNNPPREWNVRFVLPLKLEI